MYVIDGIAYAGELPRPIRVRSVKAIEEYRLLIQFTNEEQRIFDFKPLLDLPAFRPLKDMELFKSVYVESGTAAWGEEIDIAPETLYEESSPI